MKKLIYTGILMTVTALCSGQIVTYEPGEKINYNIQYGILTGGKVSLELRKEYLDGKEIWHSKLSAHTTGIVDAIYKVVDTYESYMDPKTELPVKAIRNIREGRYKKYNEVTFDRISRSDSAILTSKLTGIHITEKGIHDILSCFYYFRNQILPVDSALREGEIITIMTWFTDELYPIKLKYIGMDNVKTKLGRIRCYKFNPVTEKGRLFKTNEDVSFWFSTDKNYLPVKIRFDIFVGAFTAELTSFEGLKYPFEVIKK
jgi:hypothetical protein